MVKTALSVYLEHRGHLAERRNSAKPFAELGFSVNLYRDVLVIPIAAMTGS